MKEFRRHEIEWGLGVLLLSVGLSLILGLPPNWWPKMPLYAVHAGIIAAILMLISGLAILSAGLFRWAVSHRWCVAILRLWDSTWSPTRASLFAVACILLIAFGPMLWAPLTQVPETIQSPVTPVVISAPETASGMTAEQPEKIKSDEHLTLTANPPSHQPKISPHLTKARAQPSVHGGDVYVSADIHAGDGKNGRKGGDARIEGGDGCNGASGGNATVGPGTYSAGNATETGSGGDLIIKGGDAKDCK